MERKYVPLTKDGGQQLDEEWKEAIAMNIDGYTGHQQQRGALTIKLEGGQKVKLGIRKAKNGDLLLDFVPPQE
jgi:hypothetical protein